MRIRCLFASVILTGVTIMQTGCWTVVAVGGAAGGVAYAKGDLEAVLDESPPRVTAAAGHSLEQMDIHVLQSRSSDVDGEVIGRTAQDKKITIKIKRLSDSTSKISIRVGTFGDEAISRAIYDRIRKKLGLT